LLCYFGMFRMFLFLGIHLMNVKLLILLCFERLGGHNSRKCIIFNVCYDRKLTFLKPKTTLIYQACSQISLMSIYDGFYCWFDGSMSKWNGYPSFHLLLSNCSLLVPSFAFDGPFRSTLNWKNMGYRVKVVFGHSNM